MKGYSTQQPENAVPHNGGWQYRFNIAQVTRTDDEGVEYIEWEYDYINSSTAPGTRDYLKMVRDIKIAEPINNVQVGRFEDRENIKDVVRKWDTLGNPATITWIMYDNTTAQLSKQDLIDIEDAYAGRQLQVFAEYQSLCEQLAVSDDPKSIIWS
jgi:hypothetical protein